MMNEQEQGTTIGMARESIQDWGYVIQDSWKRTNNTTNNATIYEFEVKQKLGCDMTLSDLRQKICDMYPDIQVMVY